MAELREGFENLQFKEVTTYLNSGNVLFKTEKLSTSEIMKSIEAMILQKFHLSIPVLVISTKEVASMLAVAPSWWGTNDKSLIHYAIFLFPSITPEEVSLAVGNIKPELEQIDFQDYVIFWTTPRETFNKTQWSKIASSSANNFVTIRTANTVQKLLERSSI